MRVFLTSKKAVGVANYQEASAAVRKYIDENNLGAGCGSQLKAFTGGKVVGELGGEIAKVSYNGRVWDMEGKEIL